MSESIPISPSKPSCERDDALAVVKRLREAGHVAYFAGGCVRDELMGLTPKDYDVATDATPQRVRELFSNTQAVGAAFGVILVRHRKSVVEVATFRTDISYEDGRRPTEVRFTTAEEDAKRRDFTINGLFLDPIEYRVIDYVGGQQDIATRTLRAIGNPEHRFEEDHLRLLRAVRFAARFDLQIEAATANAIERHAAELARISPERVAEELRLMLIPQTRLRAWQMLWKFGLIQVILRRLPEHPTSPRSPSADAGPVFPHLPPVDEIHFGVALAALVLCYRAAGRPQPEQVLNLLGADEVRRSVHACRFALRFSNDEAEVMKDCLALAGFLDDAGRPTVAMLKRLLARSTSPQIRLMLEALHGSRWLHSRTTWLREELNRLSKQDFAPPPLVTGDDLIARGLQPGPAFKRALDFVYDEQLEGRVSTREEALRIAEQKVREFEQKGKGNITR